jgi:hypothetical protein
VRLFGRISHRQEHPSILIFGIGSEDATPELSNARPVLFRTAASASSRRLSIWRWTRSLAIARPAAAVV